MLALNPAKDVSVYQDVLDPAQAVVHSDSTAPWSHHSSPTVTIIPVSCSASVITVGRWPLLYLDVDRITKQCQLLDLHRTNFTNWLLLQCPEFEYKSNCI